MTFNQFRAVAPLRRRAEVARTLKMGTFLNNVRALVKDERGVTALEYGLIAGLIAVGIIGSVTALGTALTTKFNAIAAAL
jgi:pilus assembly protein Flp/PilA